MHQVSLILYYFKEVIVHIDISTHLHIVKTLTTKRISMNDLNLHYAHFCKYCHGEINCD